MGILASGVPLEENRKSVGSVPSRMHGVLLPQ